MTAKFISSNSMPAYLALSTDISSSASTIAGCVLVGKTVYLTDTNTWKIINDDLTVSTFTIDSTATVVISGSDIEIGAVELKDGSTDVRAKIITGSSIASTDNAIAVRDANPIVSGENHIGQIGGTGYIVSASFTGNGTATLHAINSAITPAAGGLVEIPNAMRVNGGTAYVMDATLATSASGVTITPKLHFYSASTVTVAVDSGSWIGLFADDVYKLGVYTLPAMTSPSGSSTDMSMATSTDTSITSHPAILVGSGANSRSIFVGIETTTAFTSSASQVWRLKLRMDQN